MKVLCYHTMAVKTDCNKSKCFAPVAQLDRASGYGPEGHGFESSSARQNKVHSLEWALFFCVKKNLKSVWAMAKWSLLFH